MAYIVRVGFCLPDTQVKSSHHLCSILVLSFRSRHHKSLQYIQTRMFEPIDSILEKYDISVNGFLPAELPLAVLPDEYYQPWERVIGRLPALLLAKRLRTEVHQMPVLSPSRLVSSRELKRAYGILAFLTHAYIWEGDVPSDVRVIFCLHLRASLSD